MTSTERLAARTRRDDRKGELTGNAAATARHDATRNGATYRDVAYTIAYARKAARLGTTTTAERASVARTSCHCIAAPKDSATNTRGASSARKYARFEDARAYICSTSRRGRRSRCQRAG